MKALTIHQPWAYAIACAGKSPENRRNWRYSYTGPLAIHAGQDYAGVDAYRRVEQLAPGPLQPPGMPDEDPAWAFGAFVAVVDLVGQHPSGECFDDAPGGCSPWADQFCTHLELENVRPLATPIPARGYQGLWTPRPEHLRLLLRAVA